MNRLILVCLSFSLGSCHNDSPLPQGGGYPHLPPLIAQPHSDPINPLSLLPLKRDSAEAHLYFEDILSHPWVRGQPDVKEITWRMVDDIRSLHRAHLLMNRYREECGQMPITFEQTSEEWVTMLRKFQQQLIPLQLDIPSSLYSILNIPSVTYSTPIPFQIYQRIYLGDNSLGLPIYFDVRVFEGGKVKRQEIEQWHFSLLKGGREAFEKHGNYYFGHGDRDIEHCDSAHGIALCDRGIFLSFLEDEHNVYVLYAEAPWEDLKEKTKTLTTLKTLKTRTTITKTCPCL